jgi:Family of unknown function (DUF6328)
MRDTMAMSSAEGAGRKSARPDERGTKPLTDIDPHDGRDETSNERADRNWSDILQELRVTQTGTQIISGFLLTLAFQQRFGQLPTYLVVTYVILVFLAACTTAIGLAPVGLHRSLFARHDKAEMVQVGDRLLLVTLTLVALLTGGVVFFVVTFVASLVAGIIAAVLIFAVLLVFLVILPSAVRRRAS